MPIQDLADVVSPPDQPVFSGSVEEWRRVERSIGTRLPPDLYDISVRYGSGQTAGITILNPFSPNYQEEAQRLLTMFRGLREDFGDAAVPFPLFPERPGLFPIGKEDHGGMLFWLADGDPDRWPIVATDTSFKYETLHMPLTAFLSGLFRKRLDCIFWDSSTIKDCYPEILFVPASTDIESD